MTHVSSEFRRVPPILFLSLRYIRHKRCTNLASRVALSPNGQNQASTWASSTRSSIECVQNYFYASDMFGANRAPIFAPTLALCLNGLKRYSTWPTSLTSSIGSIQNYLWAYGSFYPIHAPSCVKISTIAKRTEQSSTRPSYLGVPSGASNTIYEPMVRLTQTEDLSCTDANTVSKQIETRFHMTPVT
jgi:hypothetical protein